MNWPVYFMMTFSATYGGEGRANDGVLREGGVEVSARLKDEVNKDVKRVNKETTRKESFEEEMDGWMSWDTFISSSSYTF